MIELKSNLGGRWKIEAVKRDGSRRVLAEFEDPSPKQKLANAVHVGSRKIGSCK